MLIFDGRNRVTQPYNYPQHWGIDIVGDDDTTVRSVEDGIVEQVYVWDGETKTGTQSYGNLVIVRCKDRLLYYAHLEQFFVKRWQKLKAGDFIGVMGNTGNSFGAHTHFEVRSVDRRTHYDPAKYLGIPNKNGTYTDSDGWEKIKGEKWRYFKGGIAIRNQWLKDGDFWYWFGPDTFMQRGYQKVKGKWYYLNEHRFEKDGITIPGGACIITDSSGKVKGV